MSKRAAIRELTHDNWCDEETPEEMGVFRQASKDQLATRSIKRAKRRGAGLEPPDKTPQIGVFGGVNLFSEGPKPAVRPTFSFLDPVGGAGTRSAVGTADDKTNAIGFSFVPEKMKKKVEDSFSSSVRPTSSSVPEDLATENEATRSDMAKQNVATMSELAAKNAAKMSEIKTNGFGPRQNVNKQGSGPFGSDSGPFKPNSDPEKSKSDPFKSNSGPFGSNSDPFKSKSNSDPFKSKSDPEKSAQRPHDPENTQDRRGGEKTTTTSPEKKKSAQRPHDSDAQRRHDPEDAQRRHDPHDPEDAQRRHDPLAPSNRFLSHLAALNEAVLSWAKDHVARNPHVNLTPVFEDYARHFTELNASFPPAGGSGNDLRPSSGHTGQAGGSGTDVRPSSGQAGGSGTDVSSSSGPTGRAGGSGTDLRPSSGHAGGSGTDVSPAEGSRTDGMKAGATEMKVGAKEMEIGATETKMKVGGNKMEVGGTEMKVGGNKMEIGGTETKVGGTEMKIGGTETKVGGIGSTGIFDFKSFGQTKSASSQSAFSKPDKTTAPFFGSLSGSLSKPTDNPLPSSGFTFSMKPEEISAKSAAGFPFSSANPSSKEISGESAKSGFTFSMNPSTEISAKSGFTFSMNPSTEISAKSAQTTTTTTGFTFSSGSTDLSAGKSGESAECEDADSPPKVQVEPISEENTVYEKKCKLFYMDPQDKSFVEKGIGNLYLKLESAQGSGADNTDKTENASEKDEEEKSETSADAKIGTKKSAPENKSTSTDIADSAQPINKKKCQLLIRALNALGNILLNIVLNASVPAVRAGRNGVMIVCVPNPPISARKSADNAPIKMLIRVKTSDDADELLGMINEYKQ